MVTINGWGSGLRETIDNDRVYELQVLLDGALKGTYKTAAIMGRSVVDSEAEKQRAALESAYPNSNCEVRRSRHTRRPLYLV